MKNKSGKKMTEGLILSLIHRLPEIITFDKWRKERRRNIGLIGRIQFISVNKVRSEFDSYFVFINKKETITK